MCRFPQERVKLLKLAKRDQDVRIHGDFNKVETVLETYRIDQYNQRQLKKIIQKIKSPSIQKIGPDGAEAVWLIAQHAANDLQFMKEVLRLIKLTTKNNPENGHYRGIPYLTDSISFMEGEPQQFGTQFWPDPVSGKAIPYPVKDIKNIDVRRKKYGLRSFKQTKRQVAEMNPDLKKKKILKVLYC